MTNNVVVAASMAVREGKVAELRGLAEEMSTSAQQEPGTIAYEWHISEDGARCDIYERYADSAAFMAHVGGLEGQMGRLMALVTPTNVTVYGMPDEQARAVLSGWHPTFMTQVAGFTR